MPIVLTSIIPIAKKNYQIHTLDKDINPENAVEIGISMIGDVLTIIRDKRQQHPRAYRLMPKYILFKIIENGQPGVSKTKQIGEFRVYLPSREVEITKQWRRPF